MGILQHERYIDILIWVGFYINEIKVVPTCCVPESDFSDDIVAGVGGGRKLPTLHSLIFLLSSGHKLVNGQQMSIRRTKTNKTHDRLYLKIWLIRRCIYEPENMQCSR